MFFVSTFDLILHLCFISSHFNELSMSLNVLRSDLKFHTTASSEPLVNKRKDNTKQTRSFVTVRKVRKQRVSVYIIKLGYSGTISVTDQTLLLLQRNCDI